MKKFSSQNKLTLVNVIILCLLLSVVACDDDDSHVIDVRSTPLLKKFTIRFR